ncbi:MAG TPA: hypothetical protein VES67_03275 [Vicinamibacterales bacterium]|nr:hypothetical protein [Vicinamibacterales bacterium]
MPDITTDPHRRRPFLGWTAVVAGLVIAGWRGARAVYWWRQWRLWRADDPSAAGLYDLNFRVETSIALIGLAIAIIGVWLIRKIVQRAARVRASTNRT